MRTVFWGRQDWEPHVREAFAKLSEDDARRARACLTALHDRHLGITPALAVGLAAWIGEERGGPGEPWSILARTLSRESGGGGTGLLVRTVPGFLIQRIAAPILAQALRKLGTNVLFTGSQNADILDAETYRRYHTELSRTIGDLAMGDEAADTLLRRGQAEALRGFSAQRAVSGGDQARVPNHDVADYAYLDGTRVQVTLNTKPTRNRALKQNIRTHQRLRRQQEGGIEGIRLSRNLEEVDHMLYSEFIHPKAVMAERLLNSGYLVTSRKPKRQELRDVLVVAVFPEVMPQAQRRFLQSCWFDYSVKIAHLLYQAGLKNSRIAWLGLDPAFNWKTHIADLASLPLEEHLPPTPDHAFKNRYAAAFGWYAFLSDRTLSLRYPGRLQNPADGFLENIGTAFRSARARFSAPSRGLEISTATNKSEQRFSRTLVRLFLPQSELEQHREQLIATMGIGHGTGETLWVTAYPEAGGHTWSEWSRNRLNTFEGPAETRLAHALQQTWYDAFLKEVGRG